MTSPDRLNGTLGTPRGGEPPWPGDDPGAPAGRLIQAALAGAVVLLLSLGVRAIFSEAGSPGPLVLDDRHEVERVALDYAIAVVEDDAQRICELETADFRFARSIQDCVAQERSDPRTPATEPVSVEGGVRLGDERGWGVAVVDHTNAGEPNRWALLVVQVDGEWRIGSRRPIDELVFAHARALGLDEIAFALDVADVPAQS
jgi:hypothetical protein